MPLTASLKSSSEGVLDKAGHTVDDGDPANDLFDVSNDKDALSPE